MTDELDTLQPEVREAVNDIDSRLRDDYWWAIIRAELLRLAALEQNAKLPDLMARANRLIARGAANERAEKAEGDCNDLRKRLNDAISERNTIRRERAQEHSKHAREGAELAALKARIFQGIVLDVDDLARGHAGLPSEWRGRRVRLVVDNDD